jgi:hypothetical protein
MWMKATFCKTCPVLSAIITRLNTQRVRLVTVILVSVGRANSAVAVIGKHEILEYI